jgi:uncharacterized membrane protein
MEVFMKKKFCFTAILVCLLALGMSFTACTNPAGPEPGPGPGGNPQKITNLDLTNIIPRPVKGQAPTTSYTTGDQYSLAITWKDSAGTVLSGNFAPSTAYTATAAVTPKAGWTLNGLNANSFTHEGAGTVTFSATAITLVFPATTGEGEPDIVTELNLTNIVRQPVKNQPPTTTYNGDEYSLAITWKDSAGTALSGNFAPSTAYTATALITPKNGLTLTGLEEDSFTHNGATSVTLNAAAITLVFPATTGADELDPVTELDLTEIIPQPVTGQVPKTSYTTGDQYSLAITWKDSAGTALSGNFAPFTAYTATAAITLKTGWTLEGARSFDHDHATEVTLSATTITLVFPATGGIEVTELALSGKFAAPANRRLPERQFSTAQYSGEIKWYHSSVIPAQLIADDGIFNAGDPIIAVITLTAAENYTFTGVNANVFTYTGASAVNNAGSGSTMTVTVTFNAIPEPGLVTKWLNRMDANNPASAPYRDLYFYDDGTYMQFNLNEGKNCVAEEGLYTKTVVSGVDTYKLTVTWMDVFAATGDHKYDAIKVDGTQIHNAAIVQTGAHTGRLGSLRWYDNAVEYYDQIGGQVTNLDLTAVIPQPVKEQAPVNSYTAGKQYSLAITWKDAGGTVLNGNFAPSTAYTATAVITLKDAWFLAGLNTNSFTHTDATSVALNTTTFTLTLVFPATTEAAAPDPVSNLNLTNIIIKPVLGSGPVFTYNGEQYSLAITWKDGDTTLTSGTFAAVSYTATAVISIKTGYTLDGLTASSFTHTSATSVTFDLTNTLTLVFPVAVAPVVVLTPRSLNAFLTAPDPLATPSTPVVETDSYTGILEWRYANVIDGYKIGTTLGPVGDKFESHEKAIQAVFTLTAKPGYTFTGVGANAFQNFTDPHYNSPASTPPINAAGSGATLTVTHTFAPLARFYSGFNANSGTGIFFADNGTYKRGNVDADGNIPTPTETGTYTFVKHSNNIDMVYTLVGDDGTTSHTGYLYMANSGLAGNGNSGRFRLDPTGDNTGGTAFTRVRLNNP